MSCCCFFFAWQTQRSNGPKGKALSRLWHDTNSEIKLDRTPVRPNRLKTTVVALVLGRAGFWNSAGSSRKSDTFDPFRGCCICDSSRTDFRAFCSALDFSRACCFRRKNAQKMTSRYLSSSACTWVCESLVSCGCFTIADSGLPSIMSIKMGSYICNSFSYTFIIQRVRIAPVWPNKTYVLLFPC